MDEQTRQRNQSAVLSRITATAVGILLVAFFAVTMNNMTTISAQVESIKDGPYPVSVAAGRVETLLVQLHTIAQQPATLNNSSDIEGLREAYAAADDDMRQRISFITSNHTLNDADAQALALGYDELAQRQNTFIDLCADESVDGEQIQEYAETELYPLIDELLEIDVNILNESTAAVENMHTTVKEASLQTVIVSCVLMAAVIVSIAMYMFILRRKNQREQLLRANLEEALQLAQSASAAKSAFLSNMSHDIRTPMNAIMGLTSIARAHIDDTQRVRECLTRISSSSKHLLRLINDVLDMGKIESGKITLNEEVFSLPYLIEEFLTIVQPQAHAKKLNFNVHVGNFNHPMLVGDSMRINQMLLNLTSNAIKYTPEGGSVSVALSEHEDEHDVRYLFVVKDTGIGMEQEFLNHIFDPFEREHNEVTNFTEGTGLGMAITKSIVDLMHGTIEVESTPGEGSEFRICIPLKPADEEQSPLATSNTAEDEPLSGRVLLVEDNELNLEIASELIGALGVSVESAADGLEATEKMQSVPAGYFDLIFMDWQMPRMDGIEATKSIIAFERAHDIPHTPIVAMTANAFNEDRARALEAGMDGFMAKPIDSKELERNLRTFLSSRVPLR